MKRLFALLLALVMVLSCLPAGVFAAHEADIWETIEQIEDGLMPRGRTLTQEQTCQRLRDGVDQIIQAVERSSTCVPGSIERHGDFFFWEMTDGTACGYSPSLRAKARENAAESPEQVQTVETVSYEDKGMGPGAKNVAVFQPYYGIDTSFTAQYAGEGQAIAKYTGGSATTYRTSAATIDQIARSLETCAVVIFDSHGDTDYVNPNDDEDFTSRANTSYLSLQNGDGITAQDQQRVTGPYGSYYHAYYAGSYRDMRYYCVDGTAIANHMKTNAPYNMLWSAICLGMATDGLHAPLRAKGVEVAYGYSQSVTFRGDYAFEEAFWSRMRQGDEVKAAVSYMKSKVGNRDPYVSNYPAYPIVVSSHDAYPGHGRVDATQAVRSSWSLRSSYTIKAVSNNTAFGTVSMSGNTITASPRAGFYAQGYTATSGSATVTQNGNTFQVVAQGNCTIQINFAKKTPATVRFSTPEGTELAPVNTYVGDTITLGYPQGTLLADKESYTFAGWSTKTYVDTPSVADLIQPGAGWKVTGADVTLYAVYSYSSGQFRQVTASRSDWTGQYVLTYNGQNVLDASGTYTGTSIGSTRAAVSMSATGMTRQGSVLNSVKPNYVFTFTEAASGLYTIKLWNREAYLALTSDSNSLTTVTNGEDNTDAWWWIRYEDGNLWIQSASYGSRFLQFQPDSGFFRCYTDYQGPLTLFSGTLGASRYTTQPQLAYVCQTHSFGAWQTKTAPTCTLSGEEIRRCNNCKTVEHRATNALGHNVVNDAAQAADCTHSGRSAGRHCSRCSLILTGCKITQALGHQVVYQPETAATCTAGGKSAGSFCMRCGKVLKAQQTTPALGHELVSQDEIAPTCTQPGQSEGMYCSRCGTTFVGAHSIAATGHTWDEGRTDFNECGEILVRTCQDCGEQRVEAVTPEAHFADNVPARAPTCTEPGSTRGTRCMVCGAIIQGIEVLPATGHTHSLTRAKAPTCTEDGVTVSDRCSVCGEVFVAEQILSATGHRWSEGVVTMAPAPGQSGEISYTCLGCGITRREIVDALPVLPCAGSAACPGRSFKDMPKAGTWSHDPIDWAVMYRITSGTSSTTFSPNETCTRAQVVTFLWRLAGSPEPRTERNPFLDVYSNAYYYKPVLWAVENGITAGTSSTSFSPSDTCTRAQVVTFLWRFAGTPSAQGANPFWDVPEDAYYLQPVLWAVAQGVTKGTADNLFEPNATCTRAQVVTFLYREEQ